MKWTLWTRLWAGGALLWALSGHNAFAANAAEPSDTARALQDHVNVRIKPGTASEVIAQLKKGEPVIILEEIKLKKTNGPADWFKVALPGDKPVWIHNGFLSSNQVVMPKHLNLRSGPGEEFQIVGRAAKGTKLKPLETKGEWTKVESPAVTYGFVAASLLKREPIAAAPVKPAPTVAATPVKPKPNTTPPVAGPVAPPVRPVEPPPVPPVVPVPTETAGTNAITPLPVVTTVTPAPVGGEGATTTVTSAPIPATNATPAAVPAPPTSVVGTNVATLAPVVILLPTVKPKPGEDVHVDRLVAREGTLRSSINIQSPADHELLSVHSGKRINYLYTTNINLRPFRGKRVIVTGREVLDERWPLTPVLLIESVESVP